MKDVLAKFTCTEKAEHVAGPDEDGKPQVSCNVKFVAVTDEVFGPWTPSGSIEMAIIGSAADSFKVGKNYMVLFTLAKDDES